MKRQQNDNLKSRYEQFQTQNKGKNCSSDTMDSYYWNLKMLFEYLEANGMDKITQVDSNVIDNYILNQKEHCKKRNQYQSLYKSVSILVYGTWIDLNSENETNGKVSHNMIKCRRSD